MAYTKGTTKDTGTKGTNTQYSVSTPTEYTANGETKTFWTNIGRGFESEKGITVRLNALPISGTIFLQVPTDRE